MKRILCALVSAITLIIALAGGQSRIVKAATAENDTRFRSVGEITATAVFISFAEDIRTENGAIGDGNDGETADGENGADEKNDYSFGSAENGVVVGGANAFDVSESKTNGGDRYDEYGMTVNGAEKINVASRPLERLSVSVKTERPAFDREFFTAVQKMYNTAAVSVRSYFNEVSSGKLSVNAEMLYSNNAQVVAEHSVNYYKPRYKSVIGTKEFYKEINPSGYDNRLYDEKGNIVPEGTKGSKYSAEGSLREQLLIREAVSAVDKAGAAPDADGDGYCDSLVVIADVGSDDAGWNELLWPHMSVCHEFPEQILGGYYYTDELASECRALAPVYIGKSRVAAYDLISSGYITAKRAGDYGISVPEGEKYLYDTGVLCHEMMHNIGLYDYYSYTDPSYFSVGEFDIMGVTCAVPQYSLSYVREKLKWLASSENYVHAVKSGKYTLYPVNTKNAAKAVKIVLSDYAATGEYFMAEVRSNASGVFDGAISGSGLIIYRVNESAAFINLSGDYGSVDYGNMYGADEVYVYRTGGTKDLGSPLFSYALMNGATGFCSGNLYDKSVFGIADLKKNRNNLVCGSLRPSETIIDYTDGKNSGIVFSSITENSDGSYSFDLKLPEEDGATLVIKDTLVKRFYNGADRLYWNTTVKEGKAYVLALRSTDRLKKLAAEGKSRITFEDIKNGVFGNYKTLYSACVPTADKRLELPNFEDEALIFIAFESSNGNCALRFAECIEMPPENFIQYLMRIIDPTYALIGLIAFAATLIVVALAVSLKMKKGSLRKFYDERKKTRNK